MNISFKVFGNIQENGKIIKTIESYNVSNIFKNVYFLASKSKSKSGCDLYTDCALNLGKLIETQQNKLSKLQQKTNAATSELDQTKIKKKKLASEIEKLEHQNQFVESDTVIWTDDGFVLFSSSLFDEGSPINNSAMTAMKTRSSKIEDQLKTLSEPDQLVLKSKPKHMYLPDFSKKDLIQYRYVLEQGTDAVVLRFNSDKTSLVQYTDEMLAIDNYFCGTLDNTEAVEKANELIKNNQASGPRWKIYDKNGQWVGYRQLEGRPKKPWQ